jgi:RNA polymerase sigma-32 factor
MDIIQEGNVGLVKANEKLDPYREVSFYTYANYWVRSCILKYIMDDSRLVKISTTETMRRMYFSYNRKKNQLEMQTGRADDDSLAEILQIKKEKLAAVKERMSSSEISLATPLSDDSSWLMQDTIRQPGPGVADTVELKDLRLKVQHLLEKEQKRLTSRENLILNQRLMTDTPLTLKVIGKRLNVSRERVRQLEAKLKEKLRKAFRREFNKKTVYFHGA